MNFQLIIGLLLTMAPFIELRGGLPTVVNYTLKNNLPVLPFFLLVIFLNILIIPLIFFFLDFFHEKFLSIRFYRKKITPYLNHTHKNVHKIKKKMLTQGYLALVVFVAIPLPGTGAWSGTLIAWILGLSRKKSILAISTGVILAGLIILLISLGLFA